jgi:hypothetical protein
MHVAEGIPALQHFKCPAGSVWVLLENANRLLMKVKAAKVLTPVEVERHAPKL